MISSPALLSPSLATLRSSFRPLLSMLFFVIFLSTKSGAQNDSLDREFFDTNNVDNPRNLERYLADPAFQTPYYTLTPLQKKKRIRLVAGGHVVLYAASMVGLNSLWYKDYPRSSFHTFNDWPEWQQVDKVGHVLTAYSVSRGSMELWRWSGIDRKRMIWLGGLSGVFFQTVIEVLDGFSEEWGWSWADFGANVLGSSALIAQELAWNEQRIQLKFSFHPKNYSDPVLDKRSKDLFGNSASQRFFKDYNGQTYWASANLKSFFPRSNLPPWLSLSVGYGANGMFGGRQNIAQDDDGAITFHRPDVKRYRQWYLAPDIDFTKIKTNKKAVKVFFTMLNALKFPAPALEFSNGKLKAHAIYF